MSIVLQGSTSGSITLQEPAIAGTNTINLPAASGTAVLTGVSGNVDINAASSNNVTLSTNSTERVRVDSSGNVGIGTSSPVAGYRLTLNGSAAGIYLAATSGTARNWAFGAGIASSAGELSFYDITANAERMRISSAGLVSIGMTGGSGVLNINNATVPNCRLHVNGALTTDFYASGSDTTLNTVTNGILAFGTNNTERMRITAGGDLLINTTTSRADLTIKSGADTYAGGGLCLERQANTNRWNMLTATTNDLYFGYNEADKGYFSNSTGAYTSISDIRLKKNITDISYGLKEILELRSVSYNMNEQEDSSQKTLGFIAQEAVQIVPESVSEMQNGMFGMDKSAIIPVLVKAIQELNAKVEAQAAEIAALKGVA